MKTLMINPNIYADALIEAGRKGINNNVFKRLLEEADEGDLQATQSHKNYADQSEEFRAAIKGAFSTAKPSGMRISLPHKRVTIAKRGL